MFKFITNRHFLVNLLVAFALAAAIGFGILVGLGAITNHGQFLKVPDVVSKKTTDAIKLLESKGFEVVITDSVYIDTANLGTVLKQIPDPNSTVKVNRTILLIVNRVSLPTVDVPDLVGKSMTYAIELIKRAHLKLGDTTFRPDFMAGAVLEAASGGVQMQKGSKLKWGSKIDLIVGGGLSDIQIPVPDLVGLTYSEAKTILDENGISFGAIIANTPLTDTLSAYVVKQNPERYTEDELGKTLIYIRGGQLLDVWLSQDKDFDIDSTTNTKPKNNDNHNSTRNKDKNQ